MGSQAWKKFEQSDQFYKFKLKFRQFVGKEPKLTIDVELKTETWAGWELVPDLLEQGGSVYSIGICDDIDFERVLCKKGVRVYAFDPTPYSVDWISKQILPDPSVFQFYPWAAAGTDGNRTLYPLINRKGEKSDVMYSFHQRGASKDDGVSVRALTPGSMAKELGHESIDILKMDVEGAEYEVIDSLLESDLRPRMLLIEFHHRFKTVGKEMTISSVRKLREAGYSIASISVTGREVCFVHEQALKN